MFEVGTGAALTSPLSYKREWPEDQLQAALADLEDWQQKQVLHGVGTTSLIKVIGGWLVVACPQLTDKAIGF